MLASLFLRYMHPRHFPILCQVDATFAKRVAQLWQSFMMMNENFQVLLKDKFHWSTATAWAVLHVKQVKQRQNVFYFNDSGRVEYQVTDEAGNELSVAFPEFNQGSLAVRKRINSGQRHLQVEILRRYTAQEGHSMLCEAFSNYVTGSRGAVVSKAP
jgi:hypothetical protein